MTEPPVPRDEEVVALLRGGGLTPTGMHREVLWSWPQSHVERITVDGPATFVLKRARPPLTDEDRILRHLEDQSVPVPHVVLSCRDGGQLTMLLEDLGPTLRDATLDEAAHLAVRIHRATPPSDLRLLDTEALRAIPRAVSEGMDVLEAAGRWTDTERLRTLLHGAERIVERLVDGAQGPPFGLCHSEFHPSSIHIGARRSGLLDLAQAFVGPGLLDLASYRNTAEPARPDVCRALIDAYCTAGGAPGAATSRAGLPAERWALAWHSLWISSLFTRYATTWMQDRQQDPAYARAVTAHLAEALDLVG